MEASNQKIAIIGSGFIGRSWAMVFVGAGRQVSLYDVDINQLKAAVADIGSQLRELEAKGLLRGSLAATEQVALVSITSCLVECVRGAVHVQECVPEILELKQRVFKELSAVTSPDCVLASSSSAIPASKFTQELAARGRCLVAHPVNPPYTMPLVELVPAPYTDPAVVERTLVLMKSIGQSPITLKKELLGFVQPRIQFAIIQQCLRLVLDDVMSVEDVDKVMTQGLGTRYAFMGPFNTIHLNGEGTRSYLERYAKMIHHISCMSGDPVDLVRDPRMEKVFSELESKVPPEQLAARRKYRNEGQAQLGQLRRNMDSKDEVQEEH